MLFSSTLSQGQQKSLGEAGAVDKDMNLKPVCLEKMLNFCFFFSESNQVVVI